MGKGVFHGIAAYVLWGIFPVYWKLLHNVAPVQIIGHRIAWSFITLLAVIITLKRWNSFRSSVLKPGTFRIYIIASLLVTVNWFIFVYGVNSGRIVETSLGYFINPLFSVILGVVFFREKLRMMQWTAVGLAAAGVLYLTVLYGMVPWIALSLSFTFGIYGLVKKIAPLDPLSGLAFETALAFPFAAVFLIYLGVTGDGYFLTSDISTDILLVLTGAVTTVPLLLFASAARSIPLSSVGILQYIAPSLQFLTGVFLFSEPFGRSDITGFGLVWTALIIFGFENHFFRSRKMKTAFVK